MGKHADNGPNVFRLLKLAHGLLMLGVMEPRFSRFRADDIPAYDLTLILHLIASIGEA